MLGQSPERLTKRTANERESVYFLLEMKIN